MKSKKIPTFEECLDIFSKRKYKDEYPLSEYLDDCYRWRNRRSQSLDRSRVERWLVPNEVTLVKRYLNEFEAWLKLQL